MRIAQKLAKQVCEEIKESVRVEASYDYVTRIRRSKSFPAFVEKLGKITEEINRTTSEFHVVKNESQS